MAKCSIESRARLLSHGELDGKFIHDRKWRDVTVTIKVLTSQMILREWRGSDLNAPAAITYMTQAWRDLDNHASVRVMTKLGMQPDRVTTTPQRHPVRVLATARGAFVTSDNAVTTRTGSKG